jgi:hypothetical protein
MFAFNYMLSPVELLILGGIAVLLLGKPLLASVFVFVMLRNRDRPAELEDDTLR